MDNVSRIINALRTGGELDLTMFAEAPARLAAAAYTTPVAETTDDPVNVADWQMDYTSGRLNESCTVTPTAGLAIEGVGLLAYSEDRLTLFFGSYNALSGTNNPGGSAYPSNSTALFDPSVHGKSVWGVVFGQVVTPDGKLSSFLKESQFNL